MSFDEITKELMQKVTGDYCLSLDAVGAFAMIIYCINFAGDEERCPDRLLVELEKRGHINIEWSDTDILTIYVLPTESMKSSF